MAFQNSSLIAIQDFLAQKRIAMVGISRAPKDFSVSLFQELVGRGYDVVPVNPKTPNVLGHKCFARVQEIDPPVDGALLMTSSVATPGIVNDCFEAGIRRIWMYRAGGKGAVDENAVAFCREHGMEVIPGECPFMFLSPSAGFIHRAHGFLKKIAGHYPQVSA